MKLEKSHIATSRLQLNGRKKKSQLQIIQRQNPQELLLIHFPISIHICFIDHLLWDSKDLEDQIRWDLRGWRGR